MNSKYNIHTQVIYYYPAEAIKTGDPLSKTLNLGGIKYIK